MCDVLMGWRVAGTGKDPKFIHNFNNVTSWRSFGTSRKRYGENREDMI